MKNKTKITSGIVSFALLFSLIFTATSPLIAYAEDEVIYIDSTEEFLEFSKNCSYDLWSKNKSFVLTNDISLDGEKFEPIPSFSGQFDGGGHTVSGIVADGTYSPCGLFGELCEGGKIANLTVVAAITPSGDGDAVGGIVGINRGDIENSRFIGTVIGSQNVGGIAGKNSLCGKIVSCSVIGDVIGESKSGGIAGSNEGLISASSIQADVNAIDLDPSISLDKLNISLTLDATKLPSLNNSAISDVGGIAGYSTGIIMGCVVSGTVGYPHIGYNIGGIVGRNSGHLNGCTNNAEVFGRKDVGGIVGQMEPYVKYELSEDLLATLKTELDRLNGIVAETMKNGGGEITTISSRLDSMLEHIDEATDEADRLIAGVTDYGDGLTNEINRFGEILSHTLDQLSEVMKDLPELSELLGKGLDELENALDGLDEVASLGANAIGDLILVARDTSNAFDSISLSLEKLENGSRALESALTVKDMAAAEEAIDMIINGLGDTLGSVDDMTATLSDLAEIFTDVTWADDVIEQIGSLVEVFGETATAIGIIYDSLTEIQDNIDIYWDKLLEAGDALVEMVGCFATASAKLDESLDLMSSGMDKMISGMDGLLEAIEVNDGDAVNSAAKQIVEGANELTDAISKESDALSELFDSLENLEGDMSLSDLFDSMIDASGELYESGTDSVQAISKLAKGLLVIFKNLKINYDTISESGSLIVGGIGDMTDSLRRMREAIKSLSEGMLALDKAISSANEAVLIKDKEKIETALGETSEAIGTIVSAAERTAEILSETAETMKEAKAWGDDVMVAVSELTESISGITSAMLSVRDGIDLLRENVSFDTLAGSDGFNMILDGVGELSNAAEYLKTALLHLSDSFADLEGAANGAADAIVDLTESFYYFNEAMEIITDITVEIKSLIAYLSGVDPIQLPKPGESITNTANRLFISISAIESDLKYLNSDLTKLSEQVVERLAAINEIFGNMSDNIVDMIYGLADGSIIDEDISESEVDSVTEGKLFSCINNGSVAGDLNVGGISGVMGLEYSLDPEDDLSPELTVTQKQQYKLKAVIHNCINNGDITAKYDSSGGITGKMDFGLILGSESYGAIESTSGNYVGGIAGISAGLISESFAKCTLSGGKYVGGIIGSGVEEDYSGDSSLVKNCYSMVKILRSSQYAGAISGARAGEYEGNLFISDSLAGIDRVSYYGKAEPITYEELAARRSIPSRFYDFTLEFVADGKVIYSTEFNYGQSFDLSAFPKIPEKEGFYGRWDTTELENLRFDTTVSAVYKPYTTTIGSGESRNDGRDIFLAVGKFTDLDSVNVTEGCDVSELVLSEKLFTKDTLVESWVLTLSGGKDETSVIHFLPSTNNCLIFIKLDGVWTQVDASEFGTYLTFDITGRTAEIAVVRQTVRILPIVIIAIVLVVFITVAIILVIKSKKANKAKNAPEEKEKA